MTALFKMGFKWVFSCDVITKALETEEEILGKGGWCNPSCWESMAFVVM